MIGTPIEQRKRSRGKRRAAALSLSLLMSLLIVPTVSTASHAAEATTISEDFTSASGAQAPDGWSVESENIASLLPGWEGWVFRTKDEIAAQMGDITNAANFSRGAGTVAVLRSDGNRPTSGNFNSTLWSKSLALSTDAESVSIDFNSHYRQGAGTYGQKANLVASFDDAEPVVVAPFNAHRENTAESHEIAVPAGAESVRIGWEYLNARNNWYWMIDNVTISEVLAVSEDSVETFSSATGATPPADWSVERINTDGMAAGWEGWNFHDIADIYDRWNITTLNEFTLGQGNVGVIISDGNRPASGYFESSLWSREYALSTDADAVQVAFDTHYRQGASAYGQQANLIASFDGAAAVVVEPFNNDRRNQSVAYDIAVPAGAETVRFGWEYLHGNNNWYWLIDNVEVTEVALADAQPTITSAKPVARPGETITIIVAGLRAGQQLVAHLDESATEVSGIPLADADGKVTFQVQIAVDQPAGFVPLELSGDGIATTPVSVSIVAAASAVEYTTEPLVWFDGFESDAWTSTGSAWAVTTREQAVADFGTNRRQAFTRASGAIALAEASQSAFDGLMTSPTFAVAGGAELELRFDSHYLSRGGDQAGIVSVSFDSGETEELRAFANTSQESAQPRLAFTVPAEATSMQAHFEFTAVSGAGTWMVDDVHVVDPLVPLDDSADPLAVVDVFSDVQGSTARLQGQVLPGLRALAPSANVVVANGDLVSNPASHLYSAYLSAFAAGGGGNYDLSISTIGNHEYYGSGSPAAYTDMFLDQMNMADVGGQGGIWGEVLVDGSLPLLWIGSEEYAYGLHGGGGGPGFVEMSDEQFGWLQERLTHYAELNQPVLLFSHHVFANSVSGTYANFYRNDYGRDRDRLQALLAVSPHVTFFTGHTHWLPTNNDWSVQQRFEPARALTPTFVNTGAVTTQYQPSGDYGETTAGGNPAGLKVALYEDRLLVTIYTFGAGGSATQANQVEIALPSEAPPAPPASIAASVDTVTQGGSLTVTGSGFTPGETVEFFLDDGTPAGLLLGSATVGADGTFTASVTLPAGSPEGPSEIIALAESGAQLTLGITVLPADTGQGDGDSTGTGDGTGTGTGSGTGDGTGTGTGTGDGTGSDSGDLATTGIGSPASLIAGIALLLVMGAAVAFGVRRIGMVKVS